ncbi:hypothetical protein [Thalassomonas actiniarum]|uniref:Uncharacterized protein n=1 Tax=Thalassomonas actiniarum TaxID=485447 RepID=A0AAE9YNG3_9GAMM|nr:hypothetical protein [Thalassomonas actiniarum]WDD96596.1 hypothetical protein SG35_014525 [Thalassomonas actiniarum]
MDSLCSYVNTHVNDAPGKDIRLSASKNENTGQVQLHGESKPSYFAMKNAEKKESFDLALRSVREAIHQIDLPGVNNEEIKDVLFSILNKKMEDSWYKGGHKNSLSMEALHSVTAAYESMINPDAVEQKVQETKVSFANTPVSFVDEPDSTKSKQVATTYSECLDRLNVSSALISSKLEALEKITVDSNDYRALALHDGTLEKLEQQLDNIDNLKDQVNRKISEQGTKPNEPMDQDIIERLNALLDTTDELVSKKIDLSRFGAVQTSEDDELDINIVYQNEDDEVDIVYQDEDIAAAFEEDMAAIVQESQEMLDDYDEVIDSMMGIFGNR